MDKNTKKCESNYSTDALKIKGIFLIGIISIIGIIILEGLSIIHNPKCECKNIVVNESQIKDSEPKRLSNVKLYEIAKERWVKYDDYIDDISIIVVFLDDVKL